MQYAQSAMEGESCGPALYGGKPVSHTYYEALIVGVKQSGKFVAYLVSNFRGMQWLNTVYNGLGNVVMFVRPTLTWEETCSWVT